MNDPNQVERFRPTISGTMEKVELGMWVHIKDFWDLKDEWIKQNILLAELTRMITQGGKE
ncbi:MAG: hypothetical protein ACXAB9_12900 [Candidatus Thorarchaeota archaeon]|jgi:hypothetical protein